MRVLVLNCGSSSVKYQLINMSDKSVMAKGLVEKIGLEDSVLIHKAINKDGFRLDAYIADHGKAIKMIIDALVDVEHGAIDDLSQIDAVGHRIVQGASVFPHPVIVDDDVVKKIADLAILAPLHNGPAVCGIEACRKNMPNKPMVVVFDTSFHQTMPPSSYMYGIPYEYYEKYAVRRYGFHGTSHRYVCNRAAQFVGKPIEELKIISCHLGNGSSLAAVKYGRVYDTSMGFTPAAGLLMGSRCGDLDPSIIPFLLEKEGFTPKELSDMFNKKSGLLGISGVSSDLRHVTDAAKAGNERAQLALDMFVKRIIQYIGAYTLQMEGLDVLVFTAGIGENSIESRENICKKCRVLGLKLDEEANNCVGIEKEITQKGSRVRAFVIHTNEELMIAEDTMRLVTAL
ncbi:MAG: acetate/propionate family kinase [Bacillota bacterium]|jgi:acetate kinase